MFSRLLDIAWDTLQSSYRFATVCGRIFKSCRNPEFRIISFFFSLVINCPVLDSPPKSVLLTIPCVRTYGSKCSFTCQTGYSSLTGNVTRTCLASGLWSGNSINCSGEWLPCFISTRTQLLKRWIVISTVEISIQWLVQLVSSILFHWREIYPMYSAIYLLSNWGLIWPQVIHTFCTFYGPWDK